VQLAGDGPAGIPADDDLVGCRDGGYQHLGLELLAVQAWFPGRQDTGSDQYAAESLDAPPVIGLAGWRACCIAFAAPATLDLTKSRDAGPPALDAESG
jgi:hypothetical protein